MDEHAKTHGMSPAGDPKNQKDTINFKGALSGLRQFLATKSPLKMMKNAVYFTSKALFVLKIFNFIILDTRLSLKKHLETVLCKINKIIGLIRKLQIFYPDQLRSHCLKLSFLPTLW